MEHGLISYGTDMRWQSHRANPFEMGLAGMVDLDSGHDLVGRSALERIKAEGPTRLRCVFKIEGYPEPKGRSARIELNGEDIGYMTECFYPERVGTTIGVGLIPANLSEPSRFLTLKHPDGDCAARIAPVPSV